jgi:hypothetical protein
MGYGGEVGLAGFPVTVSNINVRVDDDRAELRFDMLLNLMEPNISARTTATAVSEYKDRSWHFKGVSVDRILIDHVEMSGFSLNGEIALHKNDPVYGTGFGGNISASFGAFSDELNIGVTAVFGRTDFRYWYMEGTGNFSAGIPVGGAVFINGFTGGAYYKMRSTGRSGLAAYAPDASSSLGVKAGVSLYVGKKDLISGKALLEMNFLSSGGIQNIRFFAQADFLKAMDGGAEKLFDGMKKTGGDMGASLSSGMGSGLDGSGLTEKIANKYGSEELRMSGTGISAYAAIDYNFPDKTFNANFKAMVNVAGGLVKGGNPGNIAGNVNLHISPQTWHVKVGTPKQPISLKTGLGPVSLTTNSYFMFGHIDEAPLPPPPAVLSQFGASSIMRFPQNLNSSMGVAFGSRFNFDTGNMTFLILYARFQAGTGFDVLLKDMNGWHCADSNEPIGFNNWYAMGQCYAYLQGSLGVKIKLFFVRKNISIISGDAVALLQAKFPNPSWIGGNLGVNTNVLGIIKLNMNFRMSFGNNCELVRDDGTEMPVDFPVISDLKPDDRAEDVDIFSEPQVRFSINMNKSLTVEDENGNKQQFSFKLSDYTLTDGKGNRQAGKLKWNSAADAVTLATEDVLPPESEITAYATVSFEEYKNGAWKTVTDNSGKIVKEERTATFKTGVGPNYIPMHNIEYMYPVYGQKNMYPKELDGGYVQMKQGQPYLFPGGFSYTASFEARDGQAYTSPFRYNAVEKRLDYPFPALPNGKELNLKFLASTISKSTGKSGESVTRTIQLDDTTSIDYEQKVAEQIVRDGNMNLLEYGFRTSRHNTFTEKMNDVSFTVPDMRYVDEDVRSLVLRTDHADYELFDEMELLGNEYTGGQPLIDAEAIPEDAYYTQDIKPIIYDWYPIPGISLNSNLMQYGVPPFKALTFYPDYIHTVVSNTYNATVSRTFPFVYDLPYYYYRHHHDLKGKIANYIYIGNCPPERYNQLLPFLNGQFKFMRQGNYKTVITYRIPTTNVLRRYELNYINTLDWRK